MLADSASVLMVRNMDKQIAEYLDDKITRLEELYKWDFDASIPLDKFGILAEGDNWLQKTISLKSKLRDYISKNPSERNEVAKYFITEWGGIRRFSRPNEVVNDFSCLQGSNEKPTNFKQKFKSVSSWSKWASLVCPDWACIYDARVAYSINAINYLGGGQHKIFPTPDGRNTRIGLLNVSTLLLEMKIKTGDSSDPKFVKNAHFVKEKDAYIKYLDLVSSVSRRLWNNISHIHDVEMLLFALADTTIYNDVYKKVCDRNGAR